MTDEVPASDTKPASQTNNNYIHDPSSAVVRRGTRYRQQPNLSAFTSKPVSKEEELDCRS